jgi:hypothetical protein
MYKIGILQPGRLGDIIICLPIAKYFYDKGYKVIWPIFSNYINDVVETIDYVDFIPVTNNVYNCVEETNNIFNNYKNIKVFDIAATFPGSTCTEEYVRLGDGFGDVTFDKFKYNVCQVPFEQKWDLSFKRLKKIENKIYNEVINVPEYNILGLTHSRGKVNVDFESKYPNFEINQNYNFFAWYEVLKNAKNLILVDSAMSNFVEQCNFTNKKTLITKPNQPLPFFKNDWVVKSYNI